MHPAPPARAASSVTTLGIALGAALGALAAGALACADAPTAPAARGPGRDLAGVAAPALDPDGLAPLPCEPADTADLNLFDAHDAACGGVRPGARLWLKDATAYPFVNTCTMAFLLKGSDGRRYVSTAGHCPPGYGGKLVWGSGSGPVAYDADGNVIGRYVYSYFDTGRDRDMSLIRLDPAVRSSPQLCVWGGPTGVDADRAPDPVVVHVYGQSLLIRSVARARTGVAQNTLDPERVLVDAVTGPGDSGSPWIADDGRALGILSNIPIPTATATADSNGTVAIYRLKPQLAEAAAALDVTFKLLTAPRVQ